MSTMKAVRFYQYGGPEVLRYEEVPRPKAAAGEVLVRVHAASVNPVDWKIREGYLQKMIPHQLPLVPGWDLSGVVEREGAGVTTWKRGDEVYGRADITRNGTFAEYVAVKASDVVRKPRSIDHVHAAAVPLAGLAAWQALIEKMAVGKGQTVLIQGAAGGIGTFAVQLARWRGASVVATASSGNVGFLKELGVDQVIDHAAERCEAVVHDVDAVFDLVGGETLTRSIAVVKPGGVLVTMAGQPSEEAATFAWLTHRGAYEELGLAYHALYAWRRSTDTSSAGSSARSTGTIPPPSRPRNSSLRCYSRSERCGGAPDRGGAEVQRGRCPDVRVVRPRRFRRRHRWQRAEVGIKPTKLPDWVKKNVNRSDHPA